MKKVSITIYFSLVAICCFCQIEIKPEIREFAVLCESSSGSGSGFYITDSLSIYFVTAYHVLFNIQTNNLYTDSVSLISYRSDVEKDEKIVLKASLVSALSAGFILTDPKNDVVVVRMASLKSIDTIGNNLLYYKNFVRKLGSSSRINGWPIFGVLKFDQIQAGSDIYIVGYPKSLGLQGRFDLNRPLFRRGIVAGKDYTYHRIIGDGAVYMGNSGGIVFDLQIIPYQQPNVFLIGIISEYIPFNDVLIDVQGNIRSVDTKNSGYSVIIPIEYAISLIHQFKN